MGKSCFVISVIGEKGNPDREYADDIFECIIKPVAEKSGYSDVKRADHIDKAGDITIQVVEAILNSDMVIADLSIPNPNVYYELAIRHYTGRPLVQLVREGVKLPFDVQHVRSVKFGVGLRQAEQAKADLERSLRAFEGDATAVINPITQAKWLGDIRIAYGDQGQAIALITETQSAMMSTLRELKEQVSELLSRPQVNKLFLGRSANTAGLGWSDTGSAPQGLGAMAGLPPFGLNRLHSAALGGGLGAAAPFGREDEATLGPEPPPVVVTRAEGDT